MLQVRHAGQAVGTLKAEGRELVFNYDHDWLARSHAFPVSPRIPLELADYAGEEVLFFFANLLPEGNVLDTLCRLRRLPKGNVYRLLEAFGRECAGAFELVPDGAIDERKPTYEPYSQEQLSKDFAALRDNIPLLQRHDQLRLSLAGAQNKIPVRYAQGMLSLPMEGAASTHILKPALQPEKHYPHAVHNEALCMRLAAKVGIPVAAVQLMSDPEPFLLIERFDRVVDGEQVHRLHQLDFCQLAGVLPDQKYEADGGPSLADIFNLVDAYSAVPARDRLQLIDWLLFNYLIGNADAHAKNASMLYGRDGRLRLAPAYDLLSTAYWPEVSDKMATAIGGEYRPEWVMQRHWQRIAEKLGLNLTLLRRRALGLATAANDHLSRTADDLGMSPESPVVKSVRQLLAKRASRFETRLMP